MSEEEIEREISERVTGLAREMHEREKREFEKLQQCFGKLECKKVEFSLSLVLFEFVIRKLYLAKYHGQFE